MEYSALAFQMLASGRPFSDARLEPYFSDGNLEADLSGALYTQDPRTTKAPQYLPGAMCEGAGLGVGGIPCVFSTAVWGSVSKPKQSNSWRKCRIILKVPDTKAFIRAPYVKLSQIDSKNEHATASGMSPHVKMWCGPPASHHMEQKS